METLGYESVQYSPMLGAPYLDLERQLRAASAAGFDWFAVDIWSIRAFEATGRPLRELSEVASSCRLECGQLQTLLVPAPEPFDTLVEDLARAAGVLSAATVQVLPWKTSDRTLHDFRTASGQIRESAPDTVFALEYTPIQPTNSIKSSLEFIRASGVQGFGVNLDTWHFFQGDEDWPDLEALSLEDIAHLQISDHGPIASRDALQDEMMHRRALPGEGGFDLARFLSVVRNIGYHGRAGFEILSEPMRDMEPEDYAAEVHRVARMFWGTSPATP